MKHIYCISGFGADERVFSKLDFAGNTVYFIKWLTPLKNESIEQYARRMGEHIHHDNPVLTGLSFGGMMAIEIAKTIKPQQLILVSSVKTFHEIPVWMRLSGKSRLYKFFPLRSFKAIEPIENYNLGLENPDEFELVREYRRNIGQVYTDWAVRQILHWRNEWYPENCIHIHGAKDHIFPIKNVTADFIIPDGGHFMVMNRAAKINEILVQIL